MPSPAEFQKTFATLRGILASYSTELLVTVDTPADYQLCSRTLKNRIGQPLFVAAVQIKKSYVSYHLMPVYSVPTLVKNISPTLKKRMQGKSCFNFTTIDPEQVKELEALTKTGVREFKKVKLPWAQPSKAS